MTRASSPGRSVRGFSIIDLMVSIAVMAVLISILLPVLKGVQETAREVACRSNVRQLGLSTMMYAEANSGDVMPISSNVRRPGANTPVTTADSTILRTAVTPGPNGEDIDPMIGWEGLGVLFREEFVTTPQIFYCPSQKGETRFSAFASRWAGEPGVIVGNYQYRAQAPHSYGGVTRVLSAMRPSASLMADSLLSRTEMNHPTGANILRANLSVSWFEGTASLYEFLPQGGPVQTAQSIDRLWESLDRGP